MISWSLNMSQAYQAFSSKSIQHDRLASARLGGSSFYIAGVDPAVVTAANEKFGKKLKASW